MRTMLQRDSYFVCVFPPTQWPGGLLNDAAAALDPGVNRYMPL